jgi:hypothetical protein
MTTKKHICIVLFVFLIPAFAFSQQHGVSIHSNIGLYDKCMISNGKIIDVEKPGLFQRYNAGYVYQLNKWTFGMNAYYMNARIRGEYEQRLSNPESGETKIFVWKEKYSGHLIGLAPFVSRIIMDRKRFNLSLKFKPGMQKIVSSKKYIEKYPPGNPDDVTVIYDWVKDENANYDQINVNFTLGIEACRNINENFAISGSMFLTYFFYQHKYDIPYISIPYAYGIGIGLTYYFTPSGSSEN